MGIFLKPFEPVPGSLGKAEVDAAKGQSPSSEGVKDFDPSWQAEKRPSHTSCSAFNLDMARDMVPWTTLIMSFEIAAFRGLPAEARRNQGNDGGVLDIVCVLHQFKLHRSGDERDAIPLGILCF
jgi:hypothetical protein